MNDLQNKSRIQAIQQLIVGFLTYASILICSLFLSRTMGPVVFGNYNIAIAVLSIFTTVTLLGTDISVTRFIPPLNNEGNNNQIAQYFSWNMYLLKRSFQICLVTCCTLLVLGYVFHVTNYINMANYHLAIYSILLTPLLALATLISSYMISFERILKGTVYKTLVIHVLLLGYFAGAFYLLKVDITTNGNIFLILTLSVFSLFFLELYSGRKKIFNLYQSLKLGVDTVSQDTTNIWYKTSLHLIATQIIYIALRYMDLFIVKIFSSDASAAGIYSAIMVVTHIIYFIPVSLTFLVKPSISSLYDKPEKYAELQEIINATNLIIFICCPVLLFIICFWSYDILAFFGPDFVVAKSPLIIFSLGCCFLGLSRVSQAILLFSGREKLNFYITVADIFILLILGIPATYYFDLPGIATVVAGLFFFQGMMYIFLARHYLPGIKPVSIF